MRYTWNGSYAFDIRVQKNVTLDLNGHTVKSVGGSDKQHYAILCVDGNGNLTITDSSAEKTGAIVNATTSRPAGKMSVVLYNEAGDITLNGGTFSNQARVAGNYPYVIDSITAGDTSLTINDGVKLVSDGYMTLRAMSQGGSGTQTVIINGGDFVGGIWAVLKNGSKDVLNFTINDGTFTAENAFIVENYVVPADGAAEDNVLIAGGNFYGLVDIGSNNAGDLLKNGFITNGVYTYDPTDHVMEGFKAVSDNDGTWRIFDDVFVVETISVVFKNRAATENDVTYDIVLKANDADIINRLNSVDLSFVLDNDDMAYEILATNDEVVINPVTEGRYEFHYDGKDDDVDTDKANEIKIGSVKFTGYGVFTFEVNADADETNAAHATKMVDNLVDTFVQNGSTKGFGDLLVNTDIDNDNKGTISDEIKVPTRALTVNVDFPNAVLKKAAAYQAMKVTVSGGDLAEAIVVNLGNEGFETAITTEFEKNEAKYAVELTDGYKVTFANVLTVNTTYNITVEGAGYRTSRYSVTMTKDKTVNFWNNVKDNDTVVEEGKYSEKKNFLAGDIVADNNINIYDLSAVVSYFATTNDTSAYSDYAKYDLNRDGKIDSKDVAYVLVSWGE